MTSLKIRLVFNLLIILGLSATLYKYLTINDNPKRSNGIPATDAEIFIKNGVCYLYDPSETPSCEGLISGEGSNASFSQAEAWLPKRLPTDKDVVKLLESSKIYQDCFISQHSAAKEGNDFPIAIVFKVHKDLGQLIQFLQTVYRPQDVYCISYDLKSSAEFQRGVHAIAERLPNVILPDKHERIHWAHFSELMASVHCLKALDGLQHSWHYALDRVMMDDLPLKSPAEMASILRSLNGRVNFQLAQNSMIVPVKQRFERLTFKALHESERVDGAVADSDNGDCFKWVGEDGDGAAHFCLTAEKLPPPPHHIRLYKDITVAVPRPFAHFIATDPRAADFLQWMRYTVIPIEHFHSSLYYSLYAPEEDPKKHGRSIFRYQVWITDDWERLCHGIRNHFSCIFGVRDLPTMVRRHELFVHKLTLAVQPAAYHCLREYLHRKQVSQGNN